MKRTEYTLIRQRRHTGYFQVTFPGPGENKGTELTTRQCEAEFGVTRSVTVDFGKLVEMRLAEKLGAGRSTRYRLK